MTAPTTPTDSQKENEQLLEKMLEEHVMWLHSGGKSSKKFCAKDFLSRCRGVGVYLRDFNFTNRELAFSNFDSTNIKGVNFTGSDLTSSSFRYSVGKGVIFNNADCMLVDFSYSKLPHAQFERTRLGGANFYDAYGPFVLGYFGRHHALAYSDVAIIGCQKHSLDYWLEHGREIGLNNDYDETVINAYLSWLRSAKIILEATEP